MQLEPALREQVGASLRGFELRPAAAGPHRAAAVALVLVEEGRGASVAGLRRPRGWSTDAALILTRRAAHLGSHRGQWALPGGRIDPGESAEQAALRELTEEVGLQLPPSAVIGRLDDFVTHSGYAITPVIVWGGEAPTLEANPSEVASIHRIRLQEFLRADAPMLDPIADSPHPVLRMPVGSSWIAAPTAALIYQFRELCLCGRSTRVAHFEQPLFARR